jgi:hypothetical protein
VAGIAIFLVGRIQSSLRQSFCGNISSADFYELHGKWRDSNGLRPGVLLDLKSAKWIFRTKEGPVEEDYCYLSGIIRSADQRAFGPD